MTIKALSIENVKVENTKDNKNAVLSHTVIEELFPQKDKLQIDSLELSNSQEVVKIERNEDDKSNNAKKILKGVGIGLAIVGGILVFRNKNSAVNIERHFDRLSNNLPKAQDYLKKVFMNENLSPEEAANILNRYKQIEIDGLKMSKEEYAKAVFEEAKHDFNLRNEVNLVFKELEKNVGGETSMWGDVIIKLSQSKNEIFDAIHHELRHKYQYEAIEELRSIRVSNALLGTKYTMPPQKLEYCKKMAKAKQNYTSFEKNRRLYYKNPMEVDARDAASKMWELIKLHNIKECFSNNIFEFTNIFKSIFKKNCVA